jgi:signal transduction histidine kinase
MEEHQPSTSPYPDYRAWSDMLAGFAEKNARLANLVAKRCPPRSRAVVLTELERERSRIARELHAGAGQPLAGIKLHLEILEQSIAGLPDTARDTIGRLYTLAEQALGQVRAVSHRLHPPDWQEMPIEEALGSLLDTSGLSGKLTLTRDLRPLREEPDHITKIQIYRCAQECISNIVRHSAATEAAVALRAEDGRFLLTVTDNGHGFDISARKSGIGLRALAETAAAGGGFSTVTSGPDGTRIVVSLPYGGE